MRDPKRIPDILKRLEIVWEKYPDLRLGQLIQNVFSEYEILLYYIEDNEIIKVMENFYNNLDTRS